MEIVQLPSNITKVPKNFWALLFGASEAGKSMWIAKLIKNKAKVFHQPEYSKYIYCSPNFGESSSTSPRDLEHQSNLRKWAEPVEILFLYHIITEEELFEEAEAIDGRILLIVDDYSQELFSTDLVYKL